MSLQEYQSLVRVTPPAVEPISLTEVKEQLRIDDSDSDSILSRMISAAVEFVDGSGVLGKAMITQSWVRWVGINPGEVDIRMHPVQSLTSVKYYDTSGTLQTATVSDFELMSVDEWAVVKPKSGKAWPSAQSRDDAIRVEFTAGYGDAATDVPEPIRQALLMLVGHWYENREAVGEARLQEAPLGFNELLSAYRGQWYG